MAAPGAHAPLARTVDPAPAVNQGLQEGAVSADAGAEVRAPAGDQLPVGRQRRTPGLLSGAAASRLTVMAIRFTAIALNFAVQLVMARVMGLSAFGVANTALALLNILVIPAALGYETASVRFVALTREDGPHLRALTVHFGRNVLLSSAFTCLLIAAGAVVEQRLGNAEQAVALAMLLLIVPGFALVRVGEGWLRGFGSLVRALINSGVVIPVLSILIILGEWALLGSTRDVGVGGALGARAAATAVAVLTVGLFVSHKLDGRLRPRSPLEPTLASEIHRTAVVLCGVAFLTMAVSQMDIVAVSVVKGSSEAGLYSAASRVAQAMNVALVAVNFVLAPRIARLFADGKTGQLQQEVSSAASWCICLMGGACLLLIPGASLVLSAFGPGFGAAADALRILMLGQLVNAFCGPVGAILNMTGRQSQAIRALSVSAIVDLLLFGLLIPPLGLTGAACATAVCTAVWNIGMLFYARRYVGVWSLPGALVRILP
jgi:O-antigen/teichoic acid export membrane protein